jgi:hypothetical protein
MAKEDAFKDEDIFFNIWFIYSPFSDLTPTIDREPKRKKDVSAQRDLLPADHQRHPLVIVWSL